MGPGIITANIDNDASGITTYSVAGARFGYSLLWTLIPTTIALIVIQEMVARMAAVTGKAAGTWDRLEQVFEDRVARALSSLGVPTKKEIDKLSKRVAELTATVHKLNEGGEGVAKKVSSRPPNPQPSLLW